MVANDHKINNILWLHQNISMFQNLTIKGGDYKVTIFYSYMKRSL
jgi:hypothetical protein